MYRSATVLIKKGHRLPGYCKGVCASSARLYNRAKGFFITDSLKHKSRPQK